MKRERVIQTILSLSVCCLLFFSGCGLDVYPVVNAPTVVYNPPTYSTSDYAQKYFDFMTNDSQDSGFTYLGTAVYYKIYNNYSTMTTNISAITTLNSSTSYSAAADAMIDTYSYKELSTSSGTPSPLISDVGTKRIYIRLMDYQSDTFTAKMIIGYDGSDHSGTGTYIPRRNLSTKLTFDFGRTSTDPTYSKVPASGDADVTYSSTFSDSDSTVWYVDMFAVAVGRDDTYTKYYSKVLHLGSVPIDASAKDN